MNFAYFSIDSITDTWTFNLIVGPKSNITLPDGRNVRKVIADTMHKVQHKIMEIDEGDTKSIRAIMTVSLLILSVLMLMTQFLF